MKVFALVGKSGTGKSYQCTELAREHNIESIIDDGLLIQGNRILAGKSAKHEKTKIASVKCAIFDNDEHAWEMRQAIQKHSLSSTLILGTSKRMVVQIAQRLDLPEIEKFFFIEDISSPDEIKTASFMRNQKGQHIIPAPIIEVKKQFSGYFISSLISPGRKNHISEKTIIRPTYSYRGYFRISPKAISDICHYEMSLIPEVHRVLKVQVIPDPNNQIVISVEVSLKYPCDIPKISQKIQKVLYDSVEFSTSITAKNINISVKNIHTDK